jgi:hypothetical protein
VNIGSLLFTEILNLAKINQLLEDARGSEITSPK